MSLINKIERLNKILLKQFMALQKENDTLKEELENESSFGFESSSSIPDRRVFHINVGNFHKGKAEDYIKQLMKKYKRRSFGQNPLSTTEDYYFT